MKKGFTLIELLVVIGIFGIILLIVVPSTIRILNSSIENTMKIQEKEVEDAAKLFLEDYCKTPLDSNKVCPLSKTMIDGIAYFNGELNLDTLVDNEYINDVSLRNNECIGKIIILNNEAKAYLKCGEAYTTEGY